MGRAGFEPALDRARGFTDPLLKPLGHLPDKPESSNASFYAICIASNIFPAGLVADGANRFTGLKLVLTVPHLSGLVKYWDIYRTYGVWKTLPHPSLPSGTHLRDSSDLLYVAPLPLVTAPVYPSFSEPYGSLTI